MALLRSAISESWLLASPCNMDLNWSPTPVVVVLRNDCTDAGSCCVGGVERVLVEAERAILIEGDAQLRQRSETAQAARLSR